MSLKFDTCVVTDLEIWQPLHNMNYIDKFVYFSPEKEIVEDYCCIPVYNG